MASMFPLHVTVELLLNNTWTDISQYVYQRDPVQISGGKVNWGDTAQPATATFTLNNRDGRFTAGFVSGAYYPYLQRNVQIRIGLLAVSSSGNVYNGYRFWGTVPEWPPQSDISGKDVYVQVTASGPLRQVNTGTDQGSSLERYYASLTGPFTPVAYWPCEEDTDSGPVGSGNIGSSIAGPSMIISGTPVWKAISDFDGSAPIGILNRSVWDGLTGQYFTSGDDIFGGPGTYTWVASTTTVNAKVWAAGGGGENGGFGYAGAGGEFAQEATLAVTPGNQYTVVVGGGGAGGIIDQVDHNGHAGGDSTFQGDSVLVHAHGGHGGAHGSAAAGGTGSTNTVHFDGGNGGQNIVLNAPGAGGGSSGGTAAHGNAGGNVASQTSGAAGGAAVTGGGRGGRGGDYPFDANGSPGGFPGGGGGGGAQDSSGNDHGGFYGGSGKVELVYTPGSAPSANVIRFIMLVPVHGGNNGKVVLRTLTGGTIARLDVVYVSGGKLQLKGYSSSSTLLFTSSSISAPDGTTYMVDVELANSGGNVAWWITTIVPGASAYGAFSNGTVAGAVGNVSEVIAGPNGDITKTAIGHISVQYALVDVRQVSKALDGHTTEMTVDRFIRLAGEEALDNAVEYNETADHWGFEDGTVQGWTISNGSGSVANSTFSASGWPTEGTKSLLLTASATGVFLAASPQGTLGQPCLPGDKISADADIYAGFLLSQAGIEVAFWNASGTYLSSVTSPQVSLASGSVATASVDATVPATAAYWGIKAGDYNAGGSASRVINVDNVRVSPRMGAQTAKAYRAFLEEIKDLEQGLLREAKDLYGLRYKTRIALINQSPQVTLDYTQGTISPPLQPVYDDLLTTNTVTVKRYKGSSVTSVLTTGTLSVQEPPAGVGKAKKTLKVVAADDDQLAALAAHLLNLGTVSDERYPVITVDLTRAGITGNALAPLMSAVAQAECGDYVQLINLPAWYPSTTAKQLIIGYSESIYIMPRDPGGGWVIAWNCAPYSPWIVTATALRRW